ncbi:hypothetical protein FB451DRAFT_259590 [Mycena latifolia]|nr:hypothetical protein FB451DRAFT_259590 [Mycena latifolia]
MSRRSARLKDVNMTVEDEFVDSDEEGFTESVQEEPEFSAPKKKRRKVATVAKAEDQKLKKVRGRRGLLSSLKEFPLDVLFEIFGHLNPMDLLNLSRTTKEIRGILMVRSSAFIWKDSRSRVQGLPDLPPDLLEPQYANLAFDGHCHKCFAIPVQTIIWRARTRMCKKCIQENFVASGYQLITATDLDQSLVCLVPSFEENRPGGRHNSGRTIQLYSIDLATKLREESEDFIVNGVLQRSDPAFLGWRQQKIKEAEDLNVHAELCGIWAANRTNDRSIELDVARRLRREAIVERLTALGWGDEIPFHHRVFSGHKLVKQPKELTDRIWKNIEAPLVELLTDLKKTRLRQERQKIIKARRLLAAQMYNEFRAALGPDALLPPKVDVIRSVPFRAVIEDTPVHPEEEVTQESFAAAILQLPQFSEDWKRSKDEELLQIMKKALPDSAEADLQLATTFFSCSAGAHSSPEPIGYPRILITSAPILLSSYDPPWDPTGDQDQPLKFCFGQEVWNGNNVIRFHERAFRIMRSVLIACGLDPDVTTTAEMNEIDPAIECLNCSNDSQGRLVMRWIETASHSCGEKEKATWKCLTREEELLVEEQENANFSKYMDSYDIAWQEIFCCKFCDHPRATISRLKTHMATVHNRETMTLNDLKFPIDTYHRNRHPRPVRLVPPVKEESKEVEVASKVVNT